MHEFQRLSRTGGNRTLLVAEDDAVLRSLLAAGLRAPGWDAVEAADGAEALAILRTHPVDVLLTDLRMPVLDGFALIALARHLQPETLILATTSLGPAEHQDLPLLLGAAEIFPKPLDLPTLRAAIERLRANRPARGALQGLQLTRGLQAIGAEHPEARLDVRWNGGQGTLWLHRGELIHAVCGAREGLAAAYAILAQEQVSITFVATCPAERSIDRPLLDILLDVVLQRSRYDIPA
jgi:DNA-binding response OmpR family regulator